MGATSVTGLGPGSGSRHCTLGVSHLIGPKWHEDKDQVLKRIDSLEAENEHLLERIESLEKIIAKMILKSKD